MIQLLAIFKGKADMKSKRIGNLVPLLSLIIRYLYSSKHY
jgi:hypothetical protein